MPNSHSQFQQFRIDQNDCAQKVSTDACLLGAAADLNGSESFRSFSKSRRYQFADVPKYTFLLHSKEGEFRFNHRWPELCKVLLRQLRQHP